MGIIQMKATSELMKEHEGFMLMLGIMQKVVEQIEKNNLLDQTHQEQIVEFLKVFADKCHHGKEEDILFPELIKLGFSKDSGPVAVMLHEHTIGRKYIKDMSEHFQAYKDGDGNALTMIADDMKKYIYLLTNHIQKENQILFPMVDKTLTAELQDRLFEKYEKLEKEVIGIGRHEEFHNMLNNLRKIYIK
jgi:hemerythrin-like domain-containing protein